MNNMHFTSLFWNNRTTPDPVADLRDQLARSDAENDELRELLEERNKETSSIIERYERKIEVKDCELVHYKKMLAEAFVVLDQAHGRLKANCKHDHDDAA